MSELAGVSNPSGLNRCFAPAPPKRKIRPLFSACCSYFKVLRKCTSEKKNDNRVRPRAVDSQHASIDAATRRHRVPPLFTLHFAFCILHFFHLTRLDSPIPILLGPKHRNIPPFLTANDTGAPRRGSPMSAQGKPTRVSRALVPPWVDDDTSVLAERTG